MPFPNVSLSLGMDSKNSMYIDGGKFKLEEPWQPADAIMAVLEKGMTSGYLIDATPGRTICLRKKWLFV